MKYEIIAAIQRGTWLGTITHKVKHLAAVYCGRNDGVASFRWKDVNCGFCRTIRANGMKQDGRGRFYWPTIVEAVA